MKSFATSCFTLVFLLSYGIEAQIAKKNFLIEISGTGYFNKNPWISNNFESNSQTVQDYFYSDKMSITADIRFSKVFWNRLAFGLDYRFDFLRKTDLNFRVVFGNPQRPTNSGDNGMRANDDRTQLHSIDPFLRAYFINTKKFAFFIEPGGGLTYSRIRSIFKSEIKEGNVVLTSDFVRGTFNYFFGNLKADLGLYLFLSKKVGIGVNAGLIKYFVSDDNYRLAYFNNSKKRISLTIAYKI